MEQQLFDIVDGKVVLTIKELILPPFRKIYEADKTKDKVDAINKITYIIFMYKWNSPYAAYLDSDIRNKYICKDIFNDENWKPDILTKDAIERFLAFTNTLSIQYLQNNIDSIKKVMDFNTRVNWDELDKTGKLLYSVKDLQSNIEKAGNTIKSLQTLIEQVRREELESSRTRGGNEINNYEDVHSMRSITK